MNSDDNQQIPVEQQPDAIAAHLAAQYCPESARLRNGLLPPVAKILLPARYRLKNNTL